MLKFFKSRSKVTVKGHGKGHMFKINGSVLKVLS